MQFINQDDAEQPAAAAGARHVRAGRKPSVLARGSRFGAWLSTGNIMLELRPTCEHCNKALPPDLLEARICS